MTGLKYESSTVVARHVKVGQNLSHSGNNDLWSNYFAMDSNQE